MYCYKINNSYTIYVFPSYKEDCIKACKEKKKYKSYTTPLKSAEEKKTKFALPKKNSWLKHKKFGYGKVVSTDENGLITVEFMKKTAKFIYQDAFQKGFLTFA